MNIVKKKIGNGTNTRFCEDQWVSDTPLNLAYPRPNNLRFYKNTTVVEIFHKRWDNARFRRTLWQDTLQLWNCIKENCGDWRDTLQVWTLTKDLYCQVNVHATIEE
jgi:hypothetical protein